MKFIKKIAVLLMVVMVFNVIGCITIEQNNNTEIKILPDRNFSQGFVLTGFDSRPEYNQRDIGRIDYGLENLNPMWRIGQWGCRSNLVDATYTMQDGVDVFYDGSKTLKTNRNTGAFSLNVDGSKDGVYSGGDRKENEPWIHFILEVPDFKDYIMLKDVDSLSFNLDFMLNKEVNSCINYNPNLHTAIFMWYVTINDINKNSPTYGEYFWFGLPIYDFRHAFSPEFAQQDGGKEDATTAFIYNPKGQDFLDSPVTLNTRQNMSVDAMPLILKAFNIAQERGFLQKNGTKVNFNNLGITLMYIGWELPGTFDVGMDVYSMEIIADKK